MLLYLKICALPPLKMRDKIEKKDKSSKLLYKYDSDESADDENNYNSINTINKIASHNRYYS